MYIGGEGWNPGYGPGAGWSRMEKYAMTWKIRAMKRIRKPTNMSVVIVPMRKSRPAVANDGMFSRGEILS